MAHHNDSSFCPQPNPEMEIPRGKAGRGNGSNLSEWNSILAAAREEKQKLNIIDENEELVRSALPQLEPREIEVHNSEGAGVWMVVDNIVYDCTHWLSAHPGGRAILLKYAGKDVTALNAHYHNWVNVEALLGPMAVGILKKSDDEESSSSAGGQVGSGKSKEKQSTAQDDESFVPEDRFPNREVTNTKPVFRVGKKAKAATEPKFSEEVNSNLTKRSRDTSLHKAINLDQRDEIERMLESGNIDVNSLDEDDRTPIFLAAEKGQVELIQLLHSKSADFTITNIIGASPFFVAAQNGHLEALKLIHTLAPSTALLCTDDGASPVYTAAAKGHIHILEFLSSGEVGLDINRRLNNGATPAFAAVAKAREEAIRFLHSCGADLHLARHDGVSPYILACQQGDTAIVELLYALEGSDDGKVLKGTKMKNGATPAFVAAMKGHNEVIRFLSKVGADIDQPKNDGTTPLMVAAHQNFESTVRLLHSLGANINHQRVADGANAAYMARDNGHDDLVKVLCSLGAECPEEEPPSREIDSDE